MSKILNTQLIGIFNRLEKQSLEIQMAAQCLIQAIGGEGYVYVKGYDDLQFFESFILHSDERLKSSRKLDAIKDFKEIDSTDRVLCNGLNCIKMYTFAFSITIAFFKKYTFNLQYFNALTLFF